MIDLVDIDKNDPAFDLLAEKILLKHQSVDIFNEKKLVYRDFEIYHYSERA